MPKVNKLQSPKLRLTQSLLVATFTPNFTSRLRRKTIKMFRHTIVCVTTFTTPPLYIHLNGAYFAALLLLTGRCYETETSAILLLLERSVA